jgi:PAB1-binding protein PBP1
MEKPKVRKPRELDPDIQALDISNRQKKRIQWKRNDDKKKAALEAAEKVGTKQKKVKEVKVDAKQEVKEVKVDAKQEVKEVKVDAKQEVKEVKVDAKQEVKEVLSRKERWRQLFKLSQDAKKVLINAGIPNVLVRQRRAGVGRGSSWFLSQKRASRIMAYREWLSFAVVSKLRRRLRRVTRAERLRWMRNILQLDLPERVLFPKKKRYILPTRLIRDLGFWSYSESSFRLRCY